MSTTNKNLQEGVKDKLFQAGLNLKTTFLAVMQTLFETEIRDTIPCYYEVCIHNDNVLVCENPGAKWTTIGEDEFPYTHYELTQDLFQFAYDYKLTLHERKYLNGLISGLDIKDGRLLNI